MGNTFVYASATCDYCDKPTTAAIAIDDQAVSVCREHALYLDEARERAVAAGETVGVAIFNELNPRGRELG